MIASSSALSAAPRGKQSGWSTMRLGDVCSFLNRGISPKYLESGGIRVLNQKCIRNHAVTFEHARRHDPTAKPVSTERLIQFGDVLVNSTGIGTLGRVGQVRDEPSEPTTVDSHVTIVRPKPGHFHPGFFGYALLIIEDSIKEAGEGCGGQTELARSVLAERFSVRFPPLPEQRRIVGILDEAFAGIAAAKAQAEQNRQNARALFESHLHAVFSSGAWSRRPLGEVVDSRCSLSYGIVQPGEEYDGGLPLVRPTDLTTRFIRLNGLKRIDPKLADAYRRTALIGDDLLLCVRGSTGIVAQALPELRGANVTRGIVPVRFATSHLTQAFGYYALRSHLVQQQIAAKTYGAALMQINISDLRRVEISFPSIAEQKQIVATLDALSAETQRLEALYTKKLAALHDLKASLLHQAFSGQL